MRFRNKASGNIVSTENKAGIALMQASSRYEVVKAKKQVADTADEAKTETAVKKTTRKRQAAAKIES